MLTPERNGANTTHFTRRELSRTKPAQAHRSSTSDKHPSAPSNSGVSSGVNSGVVSGGASHHAGIAGSSPACDSHFNYHRLPHAFCEFPGCENNHNLVDVTIGKADRLFVSSPISPLSHDAQEPAVTLCKVHRQSFKARRFYIIKSSDDSLTFMRTSVIDA